MGELCLVFEKYYPKGELLYEKIWDAHRKVMRLTFEGDHYGRGSNRKKARLRNAVQKRNASSSLCVPD